MDKVIQKLPLSKVALLIGFVLVASVAALGLVRRPIELSIPEGGTVRTLPASFWGSLFTTKCEIVYQPKSLPPGEIVLLHAFFESPIVVIPSTNANVLLCLYNFDVGLRLLRIDTSKSFRPSPQRTELHYIVYGSSFEVEPGSGSDWMEALGYVEGLSLRAFRRQTVPIFDFGFWRWYGGRPSDVAHSIVII